MPKISSDWINKKIYQDRNDQHRNNMKTADVFIRPDVGDTIRGRIIGDHISFVSHWPRIDTGEKDGDDIAWKNEKFPDEKERNFKPTRICTDDTPAKERLADIDAYLAKTKCPWCKMKYQGYQGQIRYAFNIILHPEGKCKILEIPVTAMFELKKICSECADLMPDGPGSISEKVFEFVFSRPQKNKWHIERYPNLDIDDPNIASYLVGLTDKDKEALRLINSHATTEEEQLRGHDLERWYRKDYLSGEYQRALASKLGLKDGEYLELSPYELEHGVTKNIVEEFENETDDSETPSLSDQESNDDDEWGETKELVEDEDASEDSDDDEDDSPLW